MKLIVIVLSLVVVLLLSLLLWQTPNANSATNTDVTVTEIPCWAKIVQLDPNFPLPYPPCETQTAHYPTYIENFWKYVTKDITFMYGNNTVSVYGIAVGWDETRTTCTTETKRYQKDYHFTQ